MRLQAVRYEALKTEAGLMGREGPTGFAAVKFEKGAAESHHAGLEQLWGLDSARPYCRPATILP